MRILHVNSLGYEAGGTEKSVLRLKKELQKRGHNVKILTSNFTPGRALFSNYTFRHIDGFGMQLLFRLFNLNAYRALKKAIQEYKPDIIHFHRMDFLSPSVLFLTKNYPTVLTIHGPEDFIKSLLIWFLPHSFFKNGDVHIKNLNALGKLHYFYHNFLQRPLYNLGLKNVDIFISPSKNFAELIDSNIKPIISISNGIELYKFSKKVKCDYKLLYVGRLDKTKGIEYAINALPKIVQRFPKTTLTIIGEGIFKDDLIKAITKLNLQKNVSFVSWQKSNVIAEFYKKSDIILMPSVWPESFGVVGPEAMSIGRPVVGSRIGGIPDWLEDGKTGYLVEPKNSNQIADRVIKLFSDKNLMRKMGENACKKSKEFSIENHTKNIEKIYFDLLKKKNLSTTKRE